MRRKGEGAQALPEEVLRCIISAVFLFVIYSNESTATVGEKCVIISKGFAKYLCNVNHDNLLPLFSHAGINK